MIRCARAAALSTTLIRLLLASVLAVLPTLGSATPAWSIRPGSGGSGGGGDAVPNEVVIKLARAEDLAECSERPSSGPDCARSLRYAADLPDCASWTAPSPRNAPRRWPGSRTRRYAEPIAGQAPREARMRPGHPDERRDPVTTQWATDKIGLNRALGISRGSGVTVAILDTGIDATHPPLPATWCPASTSSTSIPSRASDSHGGAFGHGTHVAGLVAGMAPEAKIMPLRVLDADGLGNVWVLAQALPFALDPDGDPSTNDGAQVINMSISTPHRTRLLRELVESSGPVIVAAAGNTASSEPEYPAAENVDGLLAVGASTQRDSLAPFSSRGSWVHVAAPGVSIASSVPDGAYAAWSGTSMASALVAGEAALVRAVHPEWSSRDVAEHIERSAVRIRGDVSGGSTSPPRSWTARAAEPRTPSPRARGEGGGEGHLVEHLYFRAAAALCAAGGSTVVARVARTSLFPARPDGAARSSELPASARGRSSCCIRTTRSAWATSGARCCSAKSSPRPVPRAAILIVTGSPMIHAFRIPDGVDYIKLPCLDRVDAERYRAALSDRIAATKSTHPRRHPRTRQSIGFSPT